MDVKSISDILQSQAYLVSTCTQKLAFKALFNTWKLQKDALKKSAECSFNITW